jgi:hypothetical protein
VCVRVCACFLLFPDIFSQTFSLLLLQVGEAVEVTSYFSLLSRRRGCGMVGNEQFQRFSDGTTVGIEVSRHFLVTGMPAHLYEAK